MSVFQKEGGMPRLIRFVTSDQMPDPYTLTTYDPKFNLVVINKDIYDTLEWHKKYEAMRATSTIVI